MFKTALTAAVLASTLALAPAAVAQDWGNLINGATKAAQGFSLTAEDELAMGQAMHAEILAETPALANPAVQAYVKQVGTRLAVRAAAPYSFTFTVIDSDEVNAFAAPAGFVYVTTAALRLMGSESELAGVLGHEVAHVTKRHGIEAIKKAMLAQGAAQMALGNNNNALIELGAKIGLNLVLKGFDRAAESESDEVGAQYAAGAGYDPKGIETFLTTLGKHSGDGPIWLMPVSSHPRSDDRVVALAAKRPSAGAKAPYVGKEPFQKNVLLVIGAAGTAKP